MMNEFDWNSFLSDYTTFQEENTYSSEDSCSEHLSSPDLFFQGNSELESDSSPTGLPFEELFVEGLQNFIKGEQNPVADLQVSEQVLTPVETFHKRKADECHSKPKRPKVDETKGAIQCIGIHQKKKTQCRNAALMEFIGPRPMYCAEHIELDPNSLHEKCKASYRKEPGDDKPCREVVLKEFGLCHKHYPDKVEELIQKNDFMTAIHHQKRICEILEQLEAEAQAAKTTNSDLYQRKIKIIPKFQAMKKEIERGLQCIQHTTQPRSQVEEIPEAIAFTDFGFFDISFPELTAF